MLTKTNRLVKHEILEGKGESVISTTVFSTSVSMDVIKTGWLGKDIVCAQKQSSLPIVLKI